MNRAAKFFRDAVRQRDWMAVSVAGFTVFIAFWAIAIPFSPALQANALRRFQLANKSFPMWAAHQAVPAMYNFENRIRFSRVADENMDPDETHEEFVKETVNHFPARYITFGWPRGMLFKETKRGVFEMTTGYKTQQLRSRWLIVPGENGALSVNREFERLEGLPR